MICMRVFFSGQCRRVPEGRIQVLPVLQNLLLLPLLLLHLLWLQHQWKFQVCIYRAENPISFALNFFFYILVPKPGFLIVTFDYFSQLQRNHRGRRDRWDSGRGGDNSCDYFDKEEIRRWSLYNEKSTISKRYTPYTAVR